MGIYLSKPKTAKDSVAGENAEFRFAASSMQGWRTSMEDAHICAPDIIDGVHLFAVFDGHGGPEVAAFCARHFVETLKANLKFAAAQYQDALQETFLRMDEMLQMSEYSEEIRKLRESDASAQSYAGCTANVCLLTADEVICANAGDSRALLHGLDGTASLSKDHKPDLPGEKARIVAAGGYVSEGRVNENLNLSRAIGDLEYKKNVTLPPAAQIITAFPDVKTVPRNKSQSFLLLGCDGIWETLSTKDICDRLSAKLAAKELSVTAIVEDLLDALIATETSEAVGCDNMTCVLVAFK